MAIFISNGSESGTMHRKLAEVERLKMELRHLKDQVTKLVVQVEEKQAESERFNALYEAYLASYEQRRQELEGEIARLRRTLEAASRHDDERELPNTPLAPEPPTEPELAHEADDTPGPLPSNELEPPLVIPQSDNSGAVQLRQIKLFFTRQWHPDHHPVKASYMSELNRAVSASNDPADLLARIPWDEEAWFAQIESESIGAQWERLSDWLYALDLAQQRIAQELTSLTDSWLYSEYQRWLTEDKAKEYFAAQAEIKRQEIFELEDICNALQEELAAELPLHQETPPLSEETNERGD